MSSARKSSYIREIRPSSASAGPSARLPKVFGGRYVLKDKIAEGGMSNVYRAADSENGNDVVLKLPKMGESDSISPMEAYESFYNELTSLSAINSDRVVSFLGYGLEPGIVTEQPFVAMEFIEAPLLHFYSKQFLTALRRMLETFSGVCDAVQDVHEHGFVHRDLKGTNVFIMRGGAVKLFDFGFAKPIGDRAPSVLSTAGTVQFLPPERHDPGIPPHPTTDIFSLGAMLYHMVTREYHVTESGERVPLVQRRIKTDVMTEKTFNLIMRALKEKPEDRFQSAAEMKAAVQDCIASLDRAA